MSARKAKNDEVNSTETSEATKNKKSFKDMFGAKFEDQVANFRAGGAPLFWTIIISFCVMIFTCLFVFFASVQGAERVMVPNVIGKTIYVAEIEMQEKELYPELQLRYTDTIGEAGLVIEQNPEPGAIVKAYRRVTLTVSRGTQSTVIGNYIGQNFDEVSPLINKEFNNDFSLVKLAKPSYRKSEEPEGTILAQIPAPEKIINEPSTLHLVVSSGNKNLTAKVPEMKGLTTKEVLAKLLQTNLTFDFNQVEPAPGQKTSVVASQQETESELKEFSRIALDFAVIHDTASAENIQGIFSSTLPSYPYAVPVELVCKTPEGKASTIARFNHPGLELTIPYDVKKGSTLSLYVLGEKKDELILPMPDSVEK